ncbi:MAG: PAS domain S-box protein [Actinomycetes bacterium]
MATDPTSTELSALDEPRTWSRGSFVAMVVGFVAYALLTVWLWRDAAVPGPVIPATAVAHAVAMFAITGVTALVLLWYARSSGRRGYLILGCSYLYVCGVMAVFPLFFPNGLLIADPPSPLLGGTQSAIWLFWAWHVVFLVGLVAGALVLTADRLSYRQAGLGSALGWSLAAVVLLLAGTVLYVSVGHDLLPVLTTPVGITGLDYVIANSYLGFAVLGTVLVVWAARTGSVMGRWLIVLMVLLLGEGIVQLPAERYSVGWYWSRVFGFVVSAVLLVVLISALAKRLTEAERARTRATIDSLLDPHMLMEAVRDTSGIIVDFVCTDANSAACAFAGRQYQDFIGARMLDVVPGPIGADLLRVCRRVVETGAPTVLDDLPYTHEPLGGVQRYFDVRANRIGDGLAYTWRDVTARHEAELLLAASQEQYRLLAENASDIVFRGDNEAVVQWISPSVTSVLGWVQEDMVGHPIGEFVHPDDVLGTRTASENLKPGAGGAGYEARLRTRDGGYLWMAVNARPLVDAVGVVIGRVGTARDVQAEMGARQALAASEQRYRLLAQNATDAVFLVDSTGAITWLSPAVRRVLGYQSEELVGTMTANLVHPEDLSVLSSMVTKVAHGQEGVHWQVRMRTREGEYRWMSAVSGLMIDTDGVVVGRVTSVRDVHEQVLGREALARSEEMFRLAMEGAPEGMAVLGLHLAYGQVNPALCAMLGRDEAWMLSHGLRDVLAPESLEADLAARDRLLAGEAEFDMHEGRMITATGAPLWVQHSIALVRDEHRMPLFYVSQYQDITDARAAKADLEYRAQHDALTGLINREQLQRRIADVLTRVPRRAGVPALLFCDLDHFKWINDQHGHAAGDHVLRVTADRISAALRDTDEVARLGGDEFVAVLPEAFDLDAAEHVAQQVRSAVAQPIPVGGEQIVITMSIGVALATPGIEAGRLLHNADAALYEAKNSGRDQVATFS